jgi:lipoprotein NlpI
MQLKDFGGALSDFDAADHLHPLDAEILAERGAVRVYKGDFEGAKTDLAQATQLNPTNITALRSLAFVRKKTGDFPGALAALTNIVRLAPKSPEAFQSLGCTEDDLALYPAALASFQHAVELDSKMSYSRFRIWLLRTRLGEKDDANRELKAYIELRQGEDGHEWEMCIARFLVGDLTEPDFIAQAPKTAIRTTDESGHLCEACYYSGMKRLLAGDQPGAINLFQKCLATDEENFNEYLSAKALLAKLQH